MPMPIWCDWRFYHLTGGHFVVLNRYTGGNGSSGSSGSSGGWKKMH